MVFERKKFLFSYLEAPLCFHFLSCFKRCVKTLLAFSNGISLKLIQSIWLDRQDSNSFKKKVPCFLWSLSIPGSKSQYFLGKILFTPPSSFYRRTKTNKCIELLNSSKLFILPTSTFLLSILRVIGTEKKQCITYPWRIQTSNYFLLHPWTV